MSQQIFPASITEFSAESLIKKHTTTSKAIYWLFIFMVLAVVTSLFFIKVDVTINSSGIITSVEKPAAIIAPVYGKVTQLHLTENGKVQRGDILFKINQNTLADNIKIVQNKIALLRNYITDLQKLSSITLSHIDTELSLKTMLYEQAYAKFLADMESQQAVVQQQKKEYERQLLLYNKNVIAQATYEKSEYQYKAAKLKYNNLFANQIDAWKHQANQYRLQLLTLKENRNNLKHEQQKYRVTAPITGYIQNLQNIKNGSVVYPNQKVCSITPTDHLIVEAYVSTADVGYLHKNQTVKFRVDAFNFNQWGMLKGTVIDISKDVQVMENRPPMFRVRCALPNKQLSYNNAKVSVSKGMTVTANFYLTQRTLAQLFYDKITDWINPNVN